MVRVRVPVPVTKWMRTTDEDAYDMLDMGSHFSGVSSTSLYGNRKRRSVDDTRPYSGPTNTVNSYTDGSSYGNNGYSNYRSGTVVPQASTWW